MREARAVMLYPFLFAGVAGSAAITYFSVFGTRYGLDLMVYRDAVTTWKFGANPYNATFTGRHLPFTYPPFALIMLSPLAWTQFALTRCLLWVVSIAAMIGAVVLAYRAAGGQLGRRQWCLAVGWSFTSVLVLEPVRSSMDYGQIELILMFLVIADLFLIPRRYRGILIGIAAAVKLTPLVFIIDLIAMRDFRSAIRAMASFCGCAGLAWWLMPVESRGYWLHIILRPNRIGTITYAGNQSWYAIINRLSFSSNVTVAVWIMLSLATLLIGGFVAVRLVEANRIVEAVIATALIGLLVSPISWTHHWVWVVLIPPVLCCGRREPTRLLLLGLVILACLAPYWWFGGGVASDFFEALLPIYAGGVLAIWAMREWKAGATGKPSLDLMRANGSP